MRYQLTTSWRDLLAKADAWDSLWRSTPVVREECYFLEWIHTCSQLPVFARVKGHPWCLWEESDGKAVSMAPLFLQRIHVTRARLRVNAVTFMPFDHFAPQRHNILSANGTHGVERRLAEWLLTAKGVDCMILSGLTGCDARRIVSALEAGGMGCRIMRLSSAYADGRAGSVSSDLSAVAMPASWEQFIEKRGRNYVRNLRRYERKAKGEGGVRFWRYMTPCGRGGEEVSVRKIIDTIATIEHHSWQRKSGDHLGAQGYAFVCELLELLDRRGMLDVAFLYVGEAPAAYYFGVCVGEYATGLRTAYDQRYAKLSPGFLLLNNVVRSSIESTRLRRLNLYGSSHPYKARIADVRDTTYQVTAYTRTMVGRAMQVLQGVFGRHHVNLRSLQASVM